MTSINNDMKLLKIMKDASDKQTQTLRVRSTGSVKNDELINTQGNELTPSIKQSYLVSSNFMVFRLLYISSTILMIACLLYVITQLTLSDVNLFEKLYVVKFYVTSNSPTNYSFKNTERLQSNAPSYVTHSSTPTTISITELPNNEF